MINAQKSVIQLQGELLDIKTKELESVHRTVKTAVKILFKLRLSLTVLLCQNIPPALPPQFHGRELEESSSECGS